METKIHYVYLTTNLINGKQYVGDHTINGKNYIGSGTYFNNAVKKYEEGNFIKVILEWFETRDEAFTAQEKYINHFNTLIPNGYNISPKGGHKTSGSLHEETKRKIGNSNKVSLKGNIISEEAKKKISQKLKGIKKSEETKEKMSLASKGKPKSLKHAEKCRTLNLGRKQSKETIEKRRISNKKWHDEIGYSEETLQKMRSRKPTEEQKIKISNTLKNHKISTETKQKISETLKRRNAEKRDNNGK